MSHLLQELLASGSTSCVVLTTLAESHHDPSVRAAATLASALERLITGDVAGAMERRDRLVTPELPRDPLLAWALWLADDLMDRFGSEDRRSVAPGPPPPAPPRLATFPFLTALRHWLNVSDMLARREFGRALRAVEGTASDAEHRVCVASLTASALLGLGRPDRAFSVLTACDSLAVSHGELFWPGSCLLRGAAAKILGLNATAAQSLEEADRHPRRRSRAITDLIPSDILEWLEGNVTSADALSLKLATLTSSEWEAAHAVLSSRRAVRGGVADTSRMRVLALRARRKLGVSDNRELQRLLVERTIDGDTIRLLLSAA